MDRKLVWLQIAGLLLVSCTLGCSKTAPPAERPPAVDRIVVSRPSPPKHFLHKTFQVKSYARFELVVPPHTINARLQGNFQSFVEGNGGEHVSSETANVDLLLLNEEEFSEFTHGKSGTATYTVDASYNQMVDCALPSTLDDPRKYYLVFRNSPGGAPTKFVEADFTVSFE